MRTFERIAVSAWTVFVLAALPGCAVVAVAAGVASVAYVNGDLEATIDGTPQKLVQASEAALKELDIHVVSSDASGVDGRVVGRTALQKKADITIKQEPGSLIQLPAGSKLADVVKALNSLGATPQDLLAILQAMKTAGALNAEIEVI